MSKVSRKKFSTLRSVIRKEMRRKNAAPFTVFPDVYNLYFTFSVNQKTMCQMTKGLKRVPARMKKGGFQFKFTLWLSKEEENQSENHFFKVSFHPLAKLVWGIRDNRERERNLHTLKFEFSRQILKFRHVMSS